MAIDSVGGGSRDPGEAIRQRRMQDERAAELKKADERRAHELARMAETREQELANLAESHQRELESRKRGAEERVETVKSAADQRVRQFEEDTQRLTEEAKRQYQAKASQLQRTTQELNSQRERLINQHEQAMAQIRDKSLKSEAETSQRAGRDSALAHINQQRRIEDINERGDFEAERLQGDVANRKRQIVNEGAAKLKAAQDDYEDYVAQVGKQVGFAKRSGAEQMAHEREAIAKEKTRLQLEADDRANRMTLENQRALNRMHREGQSKLSTEQSNSSREIEEARKNARKALRELQGRTAHNMANLTTEAEAQEAIARTTYSNQKKLLSEARDKTIENNMAANEQLRKRLAEDQALRSKVFTDVKQKQFIAQLAADEQELKFHREHGKRQINHQVTTNAEAVASRAGKAQDAFYRVHRLGAAVQDGERETMVQLKIPEHEQDSIRITQQNGQLTLSGTRRYGDKLKTDDGHSVSTNSYQSYTESFPVRGKLEMNNMVRGYTDGVLTFRIPKA